MTSTYVVVVEHGAERLRVRSPAVGTWIAIPLPGSILGPGSGAGRLERLGRRHELVLPAGAGGCVVEVDRERAARAVEYGELLFELEPVLAPGREHTPVETAATQDGVAAGESVVVAPTDGVFYRRPAPDAPAFVEPGQTIHRGQVVGLVEVMKTFHQIVYAGAGVPDAGTVVAVRADDGQELTAGAVLVVVRPITAEP